MLVELDLRLLQTVLLFVVKNDIETLFLETGVKIRVHIIITVV